MRGYFGIVVKNLKTPANLGTLLRSAYNFEAAFIGIIGERYKHQPSDTLKAHRHIPLFHYDTDEEFLKSIPFSCQLIGIEITEASKPLERFVHPQRAVYLLGPEDGSLPEKLLAKCQSILKINTSQCLNVAVAGSIVMYDRQQKETK